MAPIVKSLESRRVEGMGARVALLRRLKLIMRMQNHPQAQALFRIHRVRFGPIRLLLDRLPDFRLEPAEVELGEAGQGARAAR